MKERKPAKNQTPQESTEYKSSPRNRALHIPLDFEKAVEGLLNVKPKKKQPKK